MSAHPNEIIKGLYIGNAENAQNLKILKELKITHVLNV